MSGDKLVSFKLASRYFILILYRICMSIYGGGIPLILRNLFFIEVFATKLQPRHQLYSSQSRIFYEDLLLHIKIIPAFPPALQFEKAYTMFSNNCRILFHSSNLNSVLPASIEFFKLKKRFLTLSFSEITP